MTSRARPRDRTLRGVIGTGILCFAGWVWLPDSWSRWLFWPIWLLGLSCLATGFVLNRRTRRRQASDAAGKPNTGGRVVTDGSFMSPINARVGFATGPYIDWSAVALVDSVLLREAMRPVSAPVLPGHWDGPVLLALAAAITSSAVVASQRERRRAPRT